MALRTICVYPNPVLREETEEVTVFDDELKTLVADMWETMYANDGIGLAAPQVGVSKIRAREPRDTLRGRGGDGRGGLPQLPRHL